MNKTAKTLVIIAVIGVPPAVNFKQDSGRDTGKHEPKPTLQTHGLTKSKNHM
jgi:hypothetical protein